MTNVAKQWEQFFVSTIIYDKYQVELTPGNHICALHAPKHDWIVYLGSLFGDVVEYILAYDCPEGEYWDANTVPSGTEDRDIVRTWYAMFGRDKDYATFLTYRNSGDYSKFYWAAKFANAATPKDAR